MFARTMSSSRFGTMSLRHNHSSNVHGDRKSTFSAAVTKRFWSRFIGRESSLSRSLFCLRVGFGRRDRNRFEFLRYINERLLDAHSFETRGADESDAVGALIHVGGI